MPYGRRELEPVGKALQPSGFPWSNNTILMRMQRADGLEAPAVRAGPGAEGGAETVGV